MLIRRQISSILISIRCRCKFDQRINISIIILRSAISVFFQSHKHKCWNQRVTYVLCYEMKSFVLSTYNLTAFFLSCRCRRQWKKSSYCRDASGNKQIRSFILRLFRSLTSKLYSSRDILPPSLTNFFSSITLDCRLEREKKVSLYLFCNSPCCRTTLIIITDEFDNTGHVVSHFKIFILING